MLEAEFGGVQHEPWGEAGVGDDFAGRQLAVDLVAANRVARFAQVDADLVRPPRFQPALQERVAGQRLDRRNVRHGPLALAGERRTPPPAVATVFDEDRRDRLRRHRPGDQRQIPPRHGVQLELQAQAAFGVGTPGEDEQPARLLVEPVDDAQRRQRAGPDVEPAGDGEGGEVLQGRHEFLALLRPLQLRRVPHAVDPGRLLDDDDVAVEVPHDEALGVGLLGQRLRLREQFDEFALLEPAGLVGADVAVDADAARLDE